MELPSSDLTEARFIENMRDIRTRSGMTQQALADAMTDRGHKWYRATVYTLERGERRLQLTEAFDVASILQEDPVSMMLDEPESLSDARALRRIDDDLAALALQIQNAALAYEDLRSRASWRLDQLPEDWGSSDRDRELLRVVQEGVTFSASDVVGQAFNRIGGDDGEHQQEG